MGAKKLHTVHDTQKGSNSLDTFCTRGREIFFYNFVCGDFLYMIIVCIYIFLFLFIFLQLALELRA